jgi:hypothetical protein
MTDPLELAKAGVAGLVEQDPHLLPDSMLLCSTEELLALRNRVDGVLASRLQVIDTRCATDAEYGRKTRGWLVEDQRLAHEQADRLLTVAKAMPYRPAVASALLAGEINLDHARHIAVSTKKVSPEIADVFEKELVKAAADVDPTELGKFAREIRSRLGADETAEESEQRKYDSRYCTMTRTFNGMHRIDGMLDPTGAAAVLAALAPLCRKTAEGDERSVGQRRADALIAIANLALRSGELPEVGGEKPHLVATIPWETLKSQVAAAIEQGLADLNGQEISPSTARMIACDAGIIPAVLGGGSEVLDLGRKQATWSIAQRRALNLEGPGCRWPGCQTDLAHCQAHHIDHVAHGGKTDVRNGVNVCWYHHYLIHHSSWQISKDRRNQIRVWRT